MVRATCRSPPPNLKRLRFHLQKLYFKKRHRGFNFFNETLLRPSSGSAKCLKEKRRERGRRDRRMHDGSLRSNSMLSPSLTHHRTPAWLGDLTPPHRHEASLPAPMIKIRNWVRWGLRGETRPYLSPPPRADLHSVSTASCQQLIGCVQISCQTSALLYAPLMSPGGTMVKDSRVLRASSDLSIFCG